MRRARNTKNERSLKGSEDTIGQIYPIIRSADGKVIDGFHRLDVDPNWKSITLKNVVTEEQKLIVSAHVNVIRRTVSRNEKINIINALAEIYFKQGLKVKNKVNKKDKNGFVRSYYINEIKTKIVEVLKGCMSPDTVKNYLYPKYLDQEKSKETTEIAKKRREGMSAYELIINSHGSALRARYGEGIFGRLEKEMFSKAKEDLKNDDWFINKVKTEIRKEVEEEIRLELLTEVRAQVLKEISEEFEIVLGENLHVDRELFFGTINRVENRL